MLRENNVVNRFPSLIYCNGLVFFPSVVFRSCSFSSIRFVFALKSILKFSVTYSRELKMLENKPRIYDIMAFFGSFSPLQLNTLVKRTTFLKQRATFCLGCPSPLFTKEISFILTPLVFSCFIFKISFIFFTILFILSSILIFVFVFDQTDIERYNGYFFIQVWFNNCYMGYLIR